MNQSIRFLKADGTSCKALYAQSFDPIEWTEVIPPSRKKTLQSLILDHRCWEALRKGELNELFIMLPSLRELILPIYDWGDLGQLIMFNFEFDVFPSVDNMREVDTYIGAVQCTKLNKDRVVYISGALHIPTLDKNEYRNWTEMKTDLESEGEEIITPGMLEKEITEIVKVALVSTDVEMGGNLIDMDPRKVKITVCGMRRVEG
ncbi:uncharacterized protein RAG0_10994 [Rhynchosporium agropyri]|uniref:Uncharacterized protein n=1 Tax=Rhynchosporium agropyri TaxID=914238 RepID=A0A1E1L255_9HELO|nr:uncharacterized protein RAG0_10994 [Rhynchosporium agropyri]